MTRLRSVGSEVIGPDPSRLIAALRQIGYSLEQAVADLIDNSINAGADSVLLRFICDADRVISLVVADNGQGMTQRQLRDAMKFGSAEHPQEGYLGKYGMGLKLASLSHARELSVVTRRNRQANGRCWTIEGIEKGWECEVLDKERCREALDSPWGDIDLGKNGTLVIWEHVDKLPTSRSGLRVTLRNLQRRLENHLGLVFHRFIGDGRLNILIDQQTPGIRENGLRVRIAPLDPFGYPQSGNRNYPKCFKARIEGVGTLEAEGHIWPPNSEEPEYRLGNRAAASQGFYFYRNDRLIQAGGWNGIVQSDAEQHGSLARVRVDLPPEYDSHFNLNVQKSAVVVPPTFVDAFIQALSPDGTTFEEYRHVAHVVYRKHDDRNLKSFPMVPGLGFAKQLRLIGSELLAGEADGVREVDFRWIELEPEVMFRLNREECSIELNAAYRSSLSLSDGQSRNDAPVLKMLLFAVLEGHLRAERVSRKKEEQLRLLNTLLVEATKHQP